MNFFKLFIGDYQRDTAHLNLAENGAYLILLQHYYATEKPLPKGSALHRMLRTQNKAEREAVNSVVAQFWTETEQGLINERADREIAKSAVQADANKRIAIAREAARKVAREKHESCSDDSTNRTTNDQPNHSHSHSHSNTNKSGGEALSRDPHVDNSAPPLGVDDQLQDRIAEIVAIARVRGVTIAPDQYLRRWGTEQIPDEQIIAAIDTAQQRRAAACSTQPINAAYLDAILTDPGGPKAKTKPRRLAILVSKHATPQEATEKAKELGIPAARRGETNEAFIMRINHAIEQQASGVAA